MNDHTPTFAPTGPGAYRMRNGERADIVAIPAVVDLPLPNRFVWENELDSSWYANGAHCGRHPCPMDIVGAWAEPVAAYVPLRDELAGMIRAALDFTAPENTDGAAGAILARYTLTLKANL
jgi:hypothetical protein